MNKENKISVIVPCYNAHKNLEKLFMSIKKQNYENYKVYFIDDLSIDDTWGTIKSISKQSTHFVPIKNIEKKWALRNIVDTCDFLINEHKKTNQIITIIDGDDFLINDECFNLLNKAFNEKNEFIYTAHKWDIDGRNISQELPKNINPYHYQWVTSHLRSFSLNLFKKINKENFKDVNGEYFKRGYDQALSLPLLYKAKKVKYISEICYQYNINSVSMPDRNDGGAQLNTVKFIRARGFIK